MPTVLLLLAALARPTDVLEQWEIVADPPLREGVTARGVYRRADGPRALLPDAVQAAAERPSAYVVGQQGDLPVVRGPEGWEVALPQDERESVRVVARSVREVRGVRLFRARWPALAPARVPTRRVAEVPRDWLAAGTPSDWSCADDGEADLVPCVSTARAPSPLVTRVPAPPTPRGAMALALLVVALPAAVAVWLGGARARLGLRATGALAGFAVGLAVALALLGAHAANAALAVLLATLPSALLGVLATRTRAARAAGAATLLALPLLVVTDGALAHVLPAACVAALVVAVAALAAGRDASGAEGEGRDHGGA